MYNKDSYVTVKDMREALNNLDSSFDDHIVILSKDVEGNQYKVLDRDYGFIDNNCKFTPEYDRAYYGSVGFKELDDNLISSGYTEEDLSQDEFAIDCVVIYPAD